MSLEAFKEKVKLEDPSKAHLWRELVDLIQGNKGTAPETSAPATAAPNDDLEKIKAENKMLTEANKNANQQIADQWKKIHALEDQLNAANEKLEKLKTAPAGN